MPNTNTYGWFGVVTLTTVLIARADLCADARYRLAHLFISLSLSCLVACERSPAWTGPLAARADSAMTSQVRICVKGTPPIEFLSQGDSIQMCRASHGRDIAIVWASTDGDLRSLELYHRAPRKELQALAARIVRVAKGPNAQLIGGCPTYATEGAWVWRDSTLFLDVEVEPDSNFVRESVHRGESPLAYNCRRARIGG